MKEKTDTASKIDALRAKIKEQEELRNRLSTTIKVQRDED